MTTVATTGAQGARPSESALWEYNNQTQVTKERALGQSDFKSSSVNFKIALWDTQTNGARYLKSLIHNLCTSLTPENWERITKIPNRHVGNPITVRYNGEDVCLDYLQAVYELEFIQSSVDLDGLRILEIGAGYGRTCHAIMSNHAVESYTIIDLENCLHLSRRYLKEVLSKEEYAKVNFVLAKHSDLIGDLQFDLCINIDSFAEMDADVVRFYLDHVRDHVGYLYVKNPVGKYLDKSLDCHSQGEEVVQMALNAGVLRDIIDVHDNQAVESQVDKFVQAYQPGSNWACIAAAWATPWSYYWQAIFKKAPDHAAI